MAIGDLIFGLMGQQDPRKQLIMAASGQQSAAPPAPPSGPTAQEFAHQGQAAPPPKPAEPSVMQSPSQLMDLYTKLLDRQDRNAQIDRGLGLMGASFAQDQNKANILNAFSGGGGASDGANALSTVNTIMKMSQEKAALEQKAAIRATIPTIAKKYGMDLPTAQYLFESGTLNDVIKELEKPNRQIIKNSDGTSSIIDVTNNAALGTFGPKEAGPTNDLKELAVVNSERAKAGQPPLSAEEWLATQNRARSNSVSISMPGNSKIGEEFAKTYAEEYDKAKAGINTMTSVANARENVNSGIIAGSMLSPLELEGRKMIASLFGVPDDEAENTDQFMSSMKTVVMDQIKALGSGNSITNSDRDYTAQAVGSTNTLRPESIKRILNILEKGNRNRIIQYNAEIEKLRAKNPQGADLARTIDVPDFSASYIAQIPQEAVDELVSDPSAKNIKDFNEEFGLGLAEMYIANRRQANGQ